MVLILMETSNDAAQEAKKKWIENLPGEEMHFQINSFELECEKFMQCDRV